jgi:hypothetical protein
VPGKELDHQPPKVLVVAPGLHVGQHLGHDCGVLDEHVVGVGLGDHPALGGPGQAVQDLSQQGRGGGQHLRPLEADRLKGYLLDVGQGQGQA